MARRLKNVTVTLDEETARWARVEAARRDTSVSRLLGHLLRRERRRVPLRSAVVGLTDRGGRTVGWMHTPLSEDLGEDQSLDGLTVISPFAHDPESIISGGA